MPTQRKRKVTDIRPKMIDIQRNFQRHLNNPTNESVVHIDYVDLLPAATLLSNLCVTYFSVSMVLSVYREMCIYQRSLSSRQGNTGTGHSTGTRGTGLNTLCSIIECI